MPEALSRKLGPLPVWGWIVVGLVAFLVWRRRTEPGWFPSGSVATEGEPAPTRSGFGAMVRGLVSTDEDNDEDYEETSGGASPLGRDQLPSPLSAGGADGTVERASGGATTEKTTIGLYGPGGLYTYTGDTRTGGGGGLKGNIGYGGGRR